MDDATLKSLLNAYQATPGNFHLLPVIMDAFWNRGEVRPAFEILKEIQVSDWPEDADILTPVKLCLELNEGYLALAFLKLRSDESAENLFYKAQSYLKIDQLDDAEKTYKQALELNPTIEDPDFTIALEEAKNSEFDQSDSNPEMEKEFSCNIDREDLVDYDVDRMLKPEIASIDFSGVGGLEAVKVDIRRKIITPFLKPGLFKKFKKKVGGGILLYGPPGCGKTLLARATAGECNASFYNVAITDILSMYTGESESRLSAIFERARNQTPAVLFFDEIEGLGGKRQFTQDSTSAKLVSEFLAQMDGFSQNNHGVLILAATNVPWSVDPAFRRPGRFDRVVFIPPPDKAARMEILKIHLKDRPGGEQLNLKFIADRTSGFSGADLENLIEEATDLAIEQSLVEEKEIPLNDQFIKKALANVKNTTTEWLTTARNYARYSNESGQYDDVIEFLNKHGKG